MYPWRSLGWAHGPSWVRLVCRLPPSPPPHFANPHGPHILQTSFGLHGDDTKNYAFDQVMLLLYSLDMVQLSPLSQCIVSHSACYHAFHKYLDLVLILRTVLCPDDFPGKPVKGGRWEFTSFRVCAASMCSLHPLCMHSNGGVPQQQALRADGPATAARLYLYMCEGLCPQGQCADT